jgi:uncharacterized membrane protein
MAARSRSDGMAARRPRSTSPTEEPVSNPVRPGRWHALRELRGGFVLRPGVIAIALAATAVGLSAAEQRATSVKAWEEVLDRVFLPEPEAARVVLGTIAGSMITVVSVVCSILLVALTFTSAQFSPRVLVAFGEDRVSQTTLGIFVGTFANCLLTLPAIRGGPSPFVPSFEVRGGPIVSDPRPLS